MEDVQDKRYDRIISSFEKIYKRDGRWTEENSLDLIHEAYMGNYCLTVKDSNKQVILGMDPTDIKKRDHLKSMFTHDSGVYSTKSFEIKVDSKVVGFIDIGQYSSTLLYQEDVAFKGSINKSIMASATITLVIIIILSLYFSKQFSIPIKEIANLSVSLTKGNFNVKYNTKSNIKELENLRNSINILAEKLKHQDLLRTRLVTDISHELRTPLNVFQHNLEAMLDGVIPVTTESLNDLTEEVIRFGLLIDNLNGLRQFESESSKINYEKILLDRLLTDVCKDFYIVAEQKNIKIQYYFNSNENYAIKGDKDKIKQVFINLLSNALKFNRENGTIRIQLYSNKQGIFVIIQDNGIGINENDLPFIFEHLYRGDKSRAQTEGSGIGLTVVKDILQLHNADIDVESKEGIGTTFKVMFNKTV